MALTALALVTLLVLSAAPSAARDRYVNPASGSDSIACGPVASPCETLSRTIDSSIDNDVIILASGT